MMRTASRAPAVLLSFFASNGHMMAIKAFFTRCNDKEGGFSRNLRLDPDPSPDRPTGGGVGYAAQILAALECGEPYMQGRTFAITECQVARDPHAVDTGWNVFDRLANRSGGFYKGNAITNVQVSSFVRPHSMVKCNGHSFPPGQLRNFDLAGSLGPWTGRSEELLAKLQSNEMREENLLVYKLRHRSETAPPVEHGWIVTRPEGELVLMHQTGSERSTRVMEHAKDAFTLATLEGSERLVLKIDAGVLVLADARVRALADALAYDEAAQGEIERARPRNG